MAWPCSRSGPTRARRSSRSSRAQLPGWACAVETDLAGLPRVARITRSAPRLPRPKRLEPAVGHHLGVPKIKTPEPILPVRLVALDIDGTLVGDDLVIGPDTRAAIRAARARGVIVSLVTGRMVSSAMRFARELELDSPVVGYQGALIREMPVAGSDRLGRLLVHTPMRAEVAREIVAWTRAHGLDPHLNHLERFIVRADDPRADDYGAFMGARAGARPATSSTSIRHPITKILAAGEPPLPTELAPLARERFAGLAEVTVSHPRFLEFTAPASRRVGPSAGWRGGCESRSARCSRSATSGTTSRCSPRSATARRCRPLRPRSSRLPATSRRRSPRRASPG